MAASHDGQAPASSRTGQPGTPIRIAHLETGRHYFGGARQVVYLCEGLSRRGHQCHLICPPGAEIADHAAPFAEVHPLALGGDLDLAAVPRLAACLRRLSPDILHVHSRRGADPQGGLAARLAGIPAVISRRVDNPEPRWLVALKYRLYRRVITISEGIRQVLVAEGLPPAHVVTVPSAVETASFARPCDRPWFTDTFGLDPGMLVIGMVAQLIPRKGHGVLLDALARIVDTAPPLRLLLFGKGPRRAVLEARRDALGLGGTVKFAGFRDDLERVLGCLDLVVHPAYMEGLGVALLQAAAAGVPIIATRAGGIPEIVRDGENGLLVAPGDAAALAEAIRALLENPALRRRFGARGRALAREGFSVDAMVEGNLGVYRELLDPSWRQDDPALSTLSRRKG
jgi:glycosyltransferase involved in cell wall biosynthesis